jgi:PA domain-containing protein/hemolysin type calcium-binding protein/LVIVD repeat-containing protein
MCVPAAASATPPAPVTAAWSPQTPDGGVVAQTPNHLLRPAESAAAAQLGLPPARENVELVAKLQLTEPFGDVRPEQIADVSAKGDYAYLNSWQSPQQGRCERGGVFVVDISNPAEPKQVGFLPSSLGSYPGEGSQVITVDTPAFRGDVLTINNEACGADGDATTLKGGVTLWDVTDPRAPELLADGVGDVTPSGAIPGIKNSPVHLSHSAFSWNAENDPATPDDDRAYTVFVDNEQQGGEDVDILDITNPRAPVFINGFSLTGFSGGSSAFPGDVFLHDMVVEEIGGRQILLASYWDGGYVQMDVTDPLNPTLVADSNFLAADPLFPTFTPPEGNAHQAEFSHDKQFVVGADEDFNSYRFVTDINGERFNFNVGVPVNAAGQPIPALLPDLDIPIEGDTRFIGDGCVLANVPAPQAGETIAVAERGTCNFDVKDANAGDAGYEALIIFNNVVGVPPETPNTRCNVVLNMSFANPAADIPAMFVGREFGFRIIDAHDATYSCVAHDDAASTDTPAPDRAGVPIDFHFEFDGWGYMHLFDRTTMQEIDQYAVPESMDERFALDFGDLSVHETANDPATNLAYVSYYRAGFRVLRFSRDNGLEEVGKFIDARGNNFWGVHQMTDKQGGRLILASDRDYGLYILRYTGPGAVLPPPTATPQTPSTPPSQPGPQPGACRNAVAGTASVDRLSGSAFGDSIRAGAGNDLVDGGDGDDCLFGEGGRDELSGDRGNDRVDGGADRDTLLGAMGNDVVRGGGGNDELDGGGGRDRLDGGAGADTLDAGNGRRNTLIGGAGNDELLAINGRRDTIRCGRGRDTVRADARDRVARDCERVRRVR